MTASRIPDLFDRLKRDGRKALMPFVCGGRPTIDALPDLLVALERGGASIVEIGVPFSDPIADGPVIAAAMHEALEDGVTPEQIFAQVAAARDRVEMGLVAMVSISLVHRGGGPEAFTKRAAEAGFDGFIFPDAPMEESEALIQASADVGLTASLLVAPTTPTDRAAEIAARCTGFVYLLARSGITGERADAPDVASAVARLRESATTPVAVGFGISTSDHVCAVVEHADAAIVGSALVRRMEDAHRAGKDACAAAEAFVRELAGGLPTPAAS
ncbi:MAG: tryptophan synthase subunit alpha [Planctomycetota bacterium]